ncbi:hypothetical protein BD779DRAFT_39991 [Infundibulicybe gibba]|nr:hypothetical protein BD779DRAFT_39991 [Infundibulicybe gibba]
MQHWIVPPANLEKHVTALFQIVARDGWATPKLLLDRRVRREAALSSIYFPRLRDRRNGSASLLLYSRPHSCVSDHLKRYMFHSLSPAQSTLHKSTHLPPSHATQHQQPWNCYPNLNPVIPDTLRDSDFSWQDPGRVNFSVADTDSLDNYHNWSDFPGVPVAPLLLDPPTVALLPRAQTRKSLYRNMLSILSLHTPLPSFAALLEYHDLHPHQHSIHSYNLLIELAIRHNSFGTVPWLIRAMKKDKITANVETWKLKTRWLVRTGEWEVAWHQAQSSNIHLHHTLKHTHKSTVRPRHNIPLPILLEFLQTPKRGGADNSPDQDRGAVSPNLAQYQVAMNHYTKSVSMDPTTISPHSAYFVVMMMLKLGESEAALEFTRSYFKGLPKAVTHPHARRCLDIVHLHLALSPSPRGLCGFYMARKTCISLLALHPLLVPTSSTLLLLLRPLRQAKRCGTVAWKALHNFQAQWGVGVEDRRVRRRIINFALKEGRKDIAHLLMNADQTYQWSRQTWKLERSVLGRLDQSPSSNMTRQDGRKLFKGNGKEQQLWYLLEKRVTNLAGNDLE